MPQPMSDKPLSYAELVAQVKAGQTATAYLIYGSEDYLKEQCRKLFVQKYIHEGCKETDCARHDAKHSPPPPDELRELVMTPPFMSAKRLIMLAHTDLPMISQDDKKVLDAYIDVLKHIPSDACLIVEEDKLDKRKKKWLMQLAQYMTFVELDKLTQKELCDWAAGVLAKRNVKIMSPAVTSLVDRTEGDLRSLSQEVRKLILHAQATGLSKLTLEDVELLGLPDIRGSIFDMTDAIGARKTDMALAAYDRLIRRREPVQKIRFMFARHIGQLICARDLVSANAIINELKVHPFVASKLSQQATLFQAHELEAIYDLCAQYDYAVKTGQLDEGMAMEMLLVTAAYRRKPSVLGH